MTKHAKYIVFIAAILFAMSPLFLCFANGERESIQIYAARYRYFKLKMGVMPDQPSDMVNPNVPKPKSEVPPEEPHLLPVPDRATSQPLDFAEANAELTEENQRLKAESADRQRKLDELLERMAYKSAPPRFGKPSLTFGSPPMGLSRQAPYQVTMYTGEVKYGTDWCQGCNRVGNEAKTWTRIHITPNMAVAPKGTSESYPVLTWRDAHGDVRVVNGYHSEAELVDKIERNNPSSRIQPTASGFGGTLKAREQIQAALAKWSQFLGDGDVLTVIWDRTGGSLNLLKAQTRTTQMICGPFGHLKVSGLPPQWRIENSNVGVIYRLDSGKPEFDVDPFKIDYAVSSSTGEPLVATFIDPISIGFDIYDLAVLVYDILNPKASFALGQVVSFTLQIKDGAFLLTFTGTLPQVHVAEYFEWQLPVKTITTDPSSVLITFGPQEYLFPIKDRRISVVSSAE